MKIITKYLLLINCSLFISFNAFSQQPGTPDYLLVKRGFGIFKLGDEITNYSKYIKISPYHSISSEVYELTDTEHLPSENGIKIKNIELKVNEGLIESIAITVDQNYKGALLEILKANYGEGQTTGADSKFWKSKDLKIILAYADNYQSQDMARAVFLYNSLAKDNAVY